MASSASIARGETGATGGSGVTFNECVHCGFCLPVCPTYDVLGNEMDSPRGRLYLMGALESGRLEATSSVVRHLDLCLGCRACESECPSGVPFGMRLEEARERLRASPLRPRGQRLVESLILAAVALPPRVQRVGAALLAMPGGAALARLISAGRIRRLLPRRLVSAAGLIAAHPPRSATLPEVTPAIGERKLRVGILEGCINRWIFGNVNEAGVRLLSRSGCEVVAVRGQRCCGALHAHSGDLEGARGLARANIAAFEKAGPLDAIVVTAAGCGSAMKEYGSLFDESPEWGERARALASKVKDALELLAEIGTPPAGREIRASVAYHDACHLAHAQGVRGQPRSLLAAVPGLTLTPLADSDRCCGSAGIYNVLHPEVAAAILRSKLERIAASGASVVAAANPGCILQIAAGAREARLPIRVVHPLEILDEAASS